MDKSPVDRWGNYILSTMGTRKRRQETDKLQWNLLLADRTADSNLRIPSVSCWTKSLILCGELAGIRTQDPRLKRALLYLLSYELTGKSRYFKTNIKMTFGGLVRQHLMM